jgi:hypothetical protein
MLCCLSGSGKNFLYCKLSRCCAVSRVPEKIPYIVNYPDAVLSPGFPSTPGDEPESLSAAEQRLFHLQRQLDIETKAGHPLLTMHRLFFTLIIGFKTFF